MFKTFCLIYFVISIRSVWADSCLKQKIIESYVPQAARHFKIDYFSNFKILSVDEDKFLLATDLKSIKCEFPYKIQIPSKHIAMTSTTYLPALILLGEVEALRAFQNINYIFSDLFKKNQIENLPFELKIEQLINLKVDLVMAYQENIALKDKRELFYKFQVPLVLNKDLKEDSPLGRAEWIIFISSFFNKEKQGKQFFTEIVNHYNLLKNKSHKKVKVLVGDIQNGKWVMPGAQSDLAKLIKDAGGEMVNPIQSRETQFIPLEKFFKYNLNVDFWITNNTWNSLQDFNKDSRYRLIKYKQVFNFNKKVNEFGSNDYWEMGLQRPDLILQDLQNIFLGNINQLNWYKELK